MLNAHFGNMPLYSYPSGSCHRASWVAPPPTSVYWASSSSPPKANRKRVRHRSNKSRRIVRAAAQQVQFQNQLRQQQSTAWTTHPTRYSTFPAWNCNNDHSSISMPPSGHRDLPRTESFHSRDKRMFGGEDDDSVSAMELRGPMLDVVLRLFDGVDYDDEV
ncbi:hypothetical protein CERZMDRAFT_81585 [Cercospora zeae-maydis SCOH1-5]|uniref:Uncharacterized protein n=1 Tax=Cercospora zeae-maydis SCOH1-5 TaxID=717836 RepID=A0A6A6FSY6_9PEZI|nr:hypothetical protein CERZMDRAFT_81585 [Cercospora zeae-maydis SCOH1-5]